MPLKRGFFYIENGRETENSRSEFDITAAERSERKAVMRPPQGGPKGEAGAARLPNQSRYSDIKNAPEKGLYYIERFSAYETEKSSRVRGLKSFFSERLHQFMIARLIAFGGNEHSAQHSEPFNGPAVRFKSGDSRNKVRRRHAGYRIRIVNPVFTKPERVIHLILAHRQNQKFLVIIYAFLNRGKPAVHKRDFQIRGR